jgi:hypothetical protein
MGALAGHPDLSHLLTCLADEAPPSLDATDFLLTDLLQNLISFYTSPTKFNIF